MTRDEELPNGFQDADFEAASIAAAGARIATLRRRGICTHGWIQAPPNGPAKCLDCGKVFASADALYRERDELLAR